MIILGLIVLTVVCLVAMRIARRVPRLGPETTTTGTDGLREDPRRLEAEADAAEASGDLELAVRLRFRAGLLRLERQGLLAGRDVLTAAEIADRLQSPSFRKLAADLEEILYAEAPAQSSHARSSRELWPQVQPEALAKR